MGQRWLVLFGLAVGFSAGMWAQTLGGISGEIRDPSGATIADVKVIATNVETNVARETASNSSGIFTFPSLVPGVYSVKVEAAGFQPMVRNNVELQVQQMARVYR